jgi:zinc transporter
MSESILFSYKFDGKGAGTRIDGADIAKIVKSKTLGWVHLDAQHNDTRTWLSDNVPYLDDGILDSLLADETRPRITEIGNGLLIILRGMNLNEDSNPEDMISIRMWIDPERIITTQRRDLKAVADIRVALENGNGPVSSADFIFDLTTALFKRMEPTLLELDERTDNVEEQILDHTDKSARQEVIDIRKKAIIFRRYIAPQKDAMSYLRNTNIKWMDDKHRRQLQENLDRVTRYVEDLDAIRERSQIVKDELANALADKMNKNMYMLSIIAGIFLPLGFLTGLMGINVGGMPMVDNADGFWIISGACLAFTIVTGIIFKFLKWV